MTTARTLLRTVAPPVIAAGAVVLLVHPLGAVAAPAPTGPVPTHGVAFAADSAITDGTLHTRIALAATSPSGIATVPGTTCAAALTPGTVTALDCPVGAGAATINVTLADGARVSHAVA